MRGAGADAEIPGAIPDFPEGGADVAVAGRVEGPDGRPLKGTDVTFVVTRPGLDRNRSVAISMGGGEMKNEVR